MIWDMVPGGHVRLSLSVLQNKCVPYWPGCDETKDYGKFLVTLLSERDADDYKVRVLEVTLIDGVHTPNLIPHPRLHHRQNEDTGVNTACVCVCVF